MAEFEATYSFNVRRFAKRKIEADSVEEAIAKARAQAEDVIGEEIFSIENSDGFGSTAETDPALYLDRIVDGETEEILDETLDIDA